MHGKGVRPIHRLVLGGLAAGACAFVASGAAAPQRADAMAFVRASAYDNVKTTSDEAETDLVAHPLDRFRWTKTALRYARHPSFDVTFPNPLFAGQVDEAFRTWADAATTPAGAGETYLRTSVTWSATGYDFRSLLLHEIGHTLGLAHPDEAAAVNRNYAIDASGAVVAVPQPPASAMNVFDVNTMQNTYQQSLSWDDLSAFRFGQGATALSFASAVWCSCSINVRLFATDFAHGPDLDHDKKPDFDSNLLAYGLIRRSHRVDDLDPRKGRIIDKADIWFNSAKAPSISILTRLATWEVQQTSPSPAPIRAIEIATRNASSLTVLDHLDNDVVPTGQRPLRWFKTIRDDPAIQDALLHVWTDPTGGEIPGGEAFEVGLEQDVDDWVATTLRLDHSAFSAAEVEFTVHPLLAIAETTTPGGTPLAMDIAARDHVFARRDPDGRAAVAQLLGFTLTAPLQGGAAITVTAVALADASQGGTRSPNTVTLRDLAPSVVKKGFRFVDIPPTAWGAGAEDAPLTLLPGQRLCVFLIPPSNTPTECTRTANLTAALPPADVESLRGAPWLVNAESRSAELRSTAVALIGVPAIAGADSKPIPSEVFLPVAGSPDATTPPAAR